MSLGRAFGSLLLGVLPWVGVACGGDDDDSQGFAETGGTVPGGGMGGSATGGTSTTAGGTGGGSVSVTDGCPPWPRSQLLPYVGPWFFGPHPGPCSSTVGSISDPPDPLEEYEYDTQGRVIRSDLGDVTYIWEGDAIVRETSGTTMDYEMTYEPGLLRVTANGSPLYVYHLDANGYPHELELDQNGDGEVEVWMRHEYEDCRLVARVLVDILPGMPTNEVPYSQTMEYDDAGNLVARRDTEWPDHGQTFDYSCWPE